MTKVFRLSKAINAAIKMVDFETAAELRQYREQLTFVNKELNHWEKSELRDLPGAKEELEMQQKLLRELIMLNIPREAIEKVVGK